MKKLITMLITLVMVFTMAIPVFAAEDASAEMPASVNLTSKQVKEITPEGVKAASYNYSKIKVSWNKIAGVDGYKVYRSTSKAGKYSVAYTAKTAEKVSYINTGRTSGKTYYYKVRGYKKIGKNTYYTKYSAVTSTYARPSKVTITKVYLPKDSQVRVSWNKIAGATGYQVYRKRVDKSDWKLFKSVSNKYTYATDKLLGKGTKPFGPGSETLYDYADMKYDWEYKVRAYRTVNGKKVYGLFSTPKEFVPEWTIDQIYDELWKYGESLEFPMYEVVPSYPEPDANGDYIRPKTDGSTYHMKHIIGVNEELGEWIYTNPANGNTKLPDDPKNLYRWTDKTSSWSVAWPVKFNQYHTKNSVMKKLKDSLYVDLDNSAWSNPQYWDPLWDDYDGVEFFSIYYEENGNDYKLWGLW